MSSSDGLDAGRATAFSAAAERSATVTDSRRVHESMSAMVEPILPAPMTRIECIKGLPNDWSQKSRMRRRTP